MRPTCATILGPLDPGLEVRREWDKLVVSVESGDETLRHRLVDELARIPGISWYLDVMAFPLGDMDDLARKALEVYRDRLEGKTFAVRCKRAGNHDFSSIDVERHVGSVLEQHSGAAGVDLGAPDVVVPLEIRDLTVYVVKQRHRGLGGFPLGTQDPVLSLVSGGFDSTVASYMTMKRGMRTHFCFFNLGGRDHEVGVKEVALYLWTKYGSSHRVKFVAVPFVEVVQELLDKVEDALMGVVLKRLMLRAATQLACQLEVDALVTGEAVAQVSSQTLANLAVIDSVTSHLVLRPLIATNKEDIVRMATEIGTADFAADMPEYCGVISVNPTTRAQRDKVEAEESRFDMGILDRAVASAHVQPIDNISAEDLQQAGVEILPVPLAGSVIVDIRHPDEEALAPLKVQTKVMKIPFYELHSKMADLDRDCTYMLYCDQGAMSRLHAAHLQESGYGNVKVYRPDG